MLLQSLDYLELHRRHGCVLQTGGSDQWGNITAGVELVRRADGAKVHALATPLITKADGTKFGKTETGTVWLDPELTSPYAFYQSWIQAEDSKVGEYLRQFTFVPVDEIAALEAEHAEKPGLRAAQRRLAAEVTTIVHGADETAAAELASGALFGRAELARSARGDPRRGPARGRRGRPQGRPIRRRSSTHSWPPVSPTASPQPRRAVADGGAYVNNERVTDPDLVLSGAHLLHGKWVVLRKGKRAISGVSVS